jgi:hypothetical protein
MAILLALPPLGQHAYGQLVELCTTVKSEPSARLHNAVGFNKE